MEGGNFFFSPRGNEAQELLHSTEVPEVVDLLGGDIFVDLTQGNTRRETPSVTNRSADESAELRQELHQLTGTVGTIIGENKKLHEALHRSREEAERNKKMAEDLGRSLALEIENRELKEELYRSREEERRTRRMDNTLEEEAEKRKVYESRLLKLETKEKQAKPIIKSSDVKDLRLKDMASITSTYVLNRFFKQIEAVTNDDEGRIRLAELKMEEKMVSLIEGLTVSKAVQKWEEFKKVCHEQYDCPVDPIAVVQELNTRYNYVIEDSPREFKNNLEAEISAIPAKDLPNTELLVKRKLYNGAPASMKEVLTAYLDDHTHSLESFLEIFERHRHVYLTVLRTNRIRELTEVGKVVEAAAKFPPREPVSNTVSQDAFEQLAKNQETLVRAIDSIEKSIGNRPYGNRRQYCGYCRTNAHHPESCPKSPPRGSCFDCLQMGHRRGSPECPKKQQ